MSRGGRRRDRPKCGAVIRSGRLPEKRRVGALPRATCTEEGSSASTNAYEYAPKSSTKKSRTQSRMAELPDHPLPLSAFVSRHLANLCIVADRVRGP